ncbi:MAG TPA: ATP synthase F1 subunit epsilon [Nitriliruptorales bacterium]|nr:ATP synthase F1 subunit epsilon [Nitriliruptorales bacterium]
MATMQAEVVSAEQQVFSGEASEVYARSLEGEIGILPGHQPALLALDIAPVRIKLEDGSWVSFAVHRGFLYFRENRLAVLADIAERAEEIDRARAERDLEALRAETDGTEEEQAARRDAIRRAELRLDMTERQ